jgi:hypothetical protein
VNERVIGVPLTEFDRTKRPDFPGGAFSAGDIGIFV